MTARIDRGCFKPFELVGLQFDLQDGYYPVRLRLLEIERGPKFKLQELGSAFDSLLVPARTLKVAVELMFEHEGPRVNTVSIRTPMGSAYRWPLRGQTQMTIAEFKRIRLGNGHAVKLIAFRPPELLGVCA